VQRGKLPPEVCPRCKSPYWAKAKIKNSGRNHYKADKGVVITNSTFTNSAISLAKSNKIELIDRTKLKELIQNNL